MYTFCKGSSNLTLSSDKSFLCENFQSHAAFSVMLISYLIGIVFCKLQWVKRGYLQLLGYIFFRLLTFITSIKSPHRSASKGQREHAVCLHSSTWHTSCKGNRAPVVAGASRQLSSSWFWQHWGICCCTTPSSLPSRPPEPGWGFVVALSHWGRKEKKQMSRWGKHSEFLKGEGLTWSSFGTP